MKTKRLQKCGFDVPGVYLWGDDVNVALFGKTDTVWVNFYELKVNIYSGSKVKHMVTSPKIIGDVE